MKVEVRMEGDVAMVRRWKAQMRWEVLDVYESKKNILGVRRRKKVRCGKKYAVVIM